MKHLLILIFLILLSSPLFGQEIGVLYLWKTSSGEVWKGFGDKQTHSVYKGPVENGNPDPNGQGTFSDPNGWKYVGKFKNGKMNGQGTLTSPFGSKYVGEFRDGVSNGQGTFYSPTGSKSVGEFRDGFLNGQVISTYPDGSKFVGEYKDMKKHGQGTYTWSNGEKYVGEYKNGKKWNGTGYDKNGNILYKYVNGKGIEQ